MGRSALVIRCLCVGVLITCGRFAADDSGRAAGAAGNLSSLERMGAGLPAGWRISGDGYSWEAEAAPGPLDVGAGRIRFGQRGELSLDGPAGFLQPGANHAVCIRLRSEPPGATVRLEVRDNDDDGKVFLCCAATATDTWQLAKTQSVLPKGIKDRYFLRLSAHGSNCTLWLDGLWLGRAEDVAGADWAPEVHPAGATLRPRAAWGLLSGDEPMRITAKVVGVTPPGCRLRMSAIHTNGASADLPAVALDQTGVWQDDVDITGEIAKPFGMLRVEATVIAPDGRALSAKTETLLARVPEPIPGPLPSSPFGVHVALREPDVAVAAKLGYKWCRIHDANGSTKWGLIEPEPGKWVWRDDQIDLARRQGLSILGMLDSSPPWESGTPYKGYFSIYGTPKNIDHWRNYVRQVVTRYTGRIDEWEVWNEPWDMRPDRFFQGGSPFLYVKLLIAAYREAKRANPKCTIVGVDTYPPLWDQWVLALGAMPYYDVLSWHRYDPSLHGRPGDPLARVADRLRAEQAKHGKPKPLLGSEGGPDVTIFHGSFFSFADPILSGDWSRGADNYARMFLSAIAAGNQRFIAYSIHNHPRYGLSTHMMVEPEYLLRPLHVTLAALAHFVEGARYRCRLVPVHDISAHVFDQPNARPYASGPSTVVVLISDGQDAEDLPRALPQGVRCFDRWANPTHVPKQATRSPVYLVGDGDAGAKLLDALRPDAPKEAIAAPVMAPQTAGASTSPAKDPLESLLSVSCRSFAQADPPLWTLFSAQGSLAVKASPQGALVARRAQLKQDPTLARQFKLPGQVSVVEKCLECSGELATGWARLATGATSVAPGPWLLVFSAVPDGPHGSYRFVTLSLVSQDGRGDATAERQVIDALKQWERAVPEAQILKLRDRLNPDPFCSVFCKPDGEAYGFTNPEYFATMLNQVSLWGGVSKSVMSASKISVCGDVATLLGQWDVVSPFFGSVPYNLTATLLRCPNGWRLAALCAGR
ncbi:MAG: hypothetical protein JXQ73_24480 [Phycisphaerae bacterium]|nr:hypothetical protein [Phycisphaerae bacterium]